MQGDVGGGFISLAIAVGIISLSMAGILKLFYRMLIDTPVEVIATLTNINDYVLIVLGCGITLLLGSSSISEAIFNPALAYGIIESEKVSHFCSLPKYSFFKSFCLIYYIDVPLESWFKSWHVAFHGYPGAILRKHIISPYCFSKSFLQL